MATASTDQLRMPVVKRLYQNHVLDSTRWNFVPLRDDDIVVPPRTKPAPPDASDCRQPDIFGAGTAGTDFGAFAIS